MIWIVLALLVVCSGCVSGSETALFALSRQTLAQYRRSASPLHRRIHRLVQSPRQVLMTVLITNTAVNVAIFAISYMGSKSLREGRPSLTIAFGLATLFCVVVFGEMLPKALALSNTSLLAPPAGAFILVAHAVLAPLRWTLALLLVEPLTRLLAPSKTLADTVSTEELRLLVERSAREGHISSTENDLLQGVVALDDINVREIMTPRVDLPFVTTSRTRKQVYELIEARKLQHVLACGRDLDDVRGLLVARKLYLDTKRPWTSLVGRVKFVPEQINLVQLIREFRTAPSRVAVVVDEFGGTTGIVTLRDVIRVLVGEHPDDADHREAGMVERIDDNTYRLAGDLSARVWADRFGVAGVDRSTDTLGGFVLARLGHIARSGEHIHMQNLTLTVESVRRRRIERVLVRRDDPSRAGEANASWG